MNDEVKQEMLKEVNKLKGQHENIIAYIENRKSYRVNDIVRMPIENKGGFRVWKIVGVHLGALGQESSYALQPLDKDENKTLHVPCAILETHPGIKAA